MSNDKEVSCPKCGSKKHKGIYFRTCLDCGTCYDKKGPRIGSDGVTDSKGNLICPNCQRNNIQDDNLLYVCPDCGAHYTKAWLQLDPAVVTQFETEQKNQQSRKKRENIIHTVVGIVFVLLVVILISYSCSSGKSSSSTLSAQQCSVLVVAAVNSKAPGASTILFDIEGDDPDNFKAQGSFKRSGVKYIFKTWLKNGKSVYFVADPH